MPLIYMDITVVGSAGVDETCRWVVQIGAAQRVKNAFIHACTQ